MASMARVGATISNGANAGLALWGRLRRGTAGMRRWVDGVVELTVGAAVVRASGSCLVSQSRNAAA